ncbi:hypothetical protein BG011_006027 [Mortierella polycephala]|uniref:F-box/LRR-repeat protein 15-like leucin rich repeat domain-containing protein n=1 Tax=Mortierella polycephala TaxID=41804 RepID=A0A9P6PVW3_9FUNG|nr:hypothetical protein BG011_006027 [Mortierella polycephala]
MHAEQRLIGGDMRFIAQQCTNLANLTLQYCHINTRRLDILCSGIPRVQNLTFKLCRGINSGSIAMRLSRLPQLTHLDISVHAQERGQSDWRDEHMVMLLTQCQLLRHLKIMGPDLSHIHLLGLERHLVPLALESLHLVRTFISEDGLANLLRKSPSVLRLNLLHSANWTTTVQVIAQNCNKLRTLELRNSRSIGTAAFDALFRGCGLLTYLDLSNTLIQDVAVFAMAHYCPQLQVLDLTGCTRMTQVGFMELVNTLNRLSELRVGGCTRVTIAGLSGSVPWACRGTLQVLDVSWVGIKVHKDPFDTFLQHLASLRRLKRLLLDQEVSQNPMVLRFLEAASAVYLSVAPAISRIQLAS